MPDHAERPVPDPDASGSSAVELMERRAGLLARDERDGAEYEQVTRRLRRALAVAPSVARRLTLDEPSEVLDRLVAAEPVHPFDGPDDLADRLDVDRRCYVLENPALPGRQLNVVWVALSKGPLVSMGVVLDRSSDPADPADADTATFYSVWNVESGLVGLPGGHELLLGAVARLREELPGLVELRTLSPIPGLRRRLVDEPSDLVAATVRYLCTADADGRLVDPVARFHMGNGARLVGVYEGADESSRGIERSWGVMASYRYEPEDRGANRRSLADGVPATSAALAALASQPG